MKIKGILSSLLISLTLLSGCVINVNEKDEDYVWQYNDDGHWKYYFDGTKGEKSAHKLKNDGEPIRQVTLYAKDLILQKKKCSICPYTTEETTVVGEYPLSSANNPVSFAWIEERQIFNHYISYYKHDFDGKDQYGNSKKWYDHVSTYPKLSPDTEFHVYFDVEFDQTIYFSVSEISGSGSFVLQNEERMEIEAEKYYEVEDKKYSGNLYDLSFYSFDAKKGRYYFIIYHYGYGDDTYCSHVSCEEWYYISFSEKRHNVPNK